VGWWPHEDARVNPPEPAADTPGPEAFAALSPEEQQVLLKVAEILKRLRFGTVLLVVQDGKVVQIEMAEKFRLR